MLAYLLAFSIDWSALLTQDNLVPFIFGLLIIVLPQYKEQLEKLKALFGKGETAAMKLARVQSMNAEMARDMKMLESRAEAVSRSAQMSMQAQAGSSDPRGDANVALQALTDYFVETSNPAGIETLKPVWAEVNKVTPVEVK